MQLFGPSELDGAGDLEAIAEGIFADENLRNGRTIEEIANSLLDNPESRVLKVPGTPALYAYELRPQDFPNPPVAGMIMKATR
jgi:hypothetical protein